MLFIPAVTSGFMVVNLALDTALAISYPFKYKEIMNKRKAAIMVVIARVLVASLILPLTASPSPSLDVEADDVILCPYDISMFLVLPFVRFTTTVAIVGFNVYLYFVTFAITKDCKQLVSDLEAGSRKARNLKAEIKKYKSFVHYSVTLLLIIIINGILRVVWIVFAVVRVYWGFLDDVYSLLFLVAIWTEYVNHPVVYGLILHEM